jgi:hypothetical protein
MDYGAVVNRAFQIAWRYKSLWIFGLFAGGLTNFNLSLPGDMGGETGGDLPFAVSPEALAAMMGAIALLALGFFVLYVVAYCISAGALVDGVNRIERGGVYTFGSSFSAGLDYFWRMLGLGVLYTVSIVFVFLVVIFFFVMVGVLMGVSFGEGSGGAVAVLVILGILILIPVLMALYLIIMTPFTLAQRALVVRDASIADALGEGWVLFKENFGKSLLIYLIKLGISIGVGIAMLFIFGIVALIVLVVVPNPMDHLIEFVILGIVFGLPISLLIGGFFGTFNSSLYTLFYFRLVEPERYNPPQTPPESPTIPGTTG